MKKGYMGKVLFVDLTTGEIKEEKISDMVYSRYLSGIGLASFILYNRIPENAEPLGPENMLGFMSGLLTGTGSLFTGRWMVAGKSPLTGGWGDANCGGTFSPAIKRCGYDGIFFSGISEKPVYLYMDDQVKELRDASDVWGMDTVETEEYLIANTQSKKAKVACIGPAGEKLSLISGVSTDKGRIAARSGLGAVMGSKKLKALVLAGTKRITVNNKEEIKKISRTCNKWVQFQPPFVPAFLMGPLGVLMRLMPTVVSQDGLLFKIMLKKWGTVSMNQMSAEMGDAPIKNWKGSSRDWGFFKNKSSSPSQIVKREKVKYHCYSCPLGCGGICGIKGKFSETHKPEYETVLALGGLCMNEDLDSIFYLNELLNRAGMDTISAGNTIAFALECFENSILTTVDTDGVSLEWGNSETIIKLVEMMVAREGVGDVLADGVKKAAEQIGRGAIDHTVLAGGQEPPMHDARNDPGFALHYSVEASPGKHTIGSGLYYEMFKLWQTVKGIPKITPLYMKGSKYKNNKKHAKIGAANSQFMNVVNASGACLFGVFLGSKRIRIFDWLNAATGRNLTPEEYMEVGKNIQSLKQAFNIKHGINPSDMKLSKRALGRPVQKEGANKGREVNIETMMHDYWEEFGWDGKTGFPREEQIKKLTDM